mgnify:CR=1 FL=1
MKIFIVLVLADTIFEHRGMLELLKTINSIPSDAIYELGITLFSGRNHFSANMTGSEGRANITSPSKCVSSAGDGSSAAGLKCFIRWIRSSTGSDFGTSSRPACRIVLTGKRANFTAKAS